MKVYNYLKRSGGEVPREAHNLQALVRFQPPQQLLLKRKSLQAAFLLNNFWQNGNLFYVALSM